MSSLAENRKGRRLPVNRFRAEQLRIRLLPAEREAIERVRLQHLREGHAYAATLSSWIRHQIQPYLTPDSGTHPCQISNDLYQKVEELARLLNKTPETIVDGCVSGIDNLIHHTDTQRPLIVAEWRLRQQYGHYRRKNLWTTNRES